MPNFDVTQLALLFFPGIIARIILGRLLFYKNDSAFYFILHSFVFGVFSYIILYLLKFLLSEIGIIHIDNVYEVIFISTIDKTKRIDIFEVFYATLISIPFSLIMSYIETRKYISKISRYIKISTRFSEPDVWGYTLNSDILTNNEWVTLRDKKYNLMYLGKVRAFSDSFKEAEILLEDVQVFKNDTGEELYHVDALYLAIEASNIEIQFYKLSPKEEVTSD